MPCPTPLKAVLAACPKDVPVFSFAGRAFYTRVLEIHDADSLKITLEFPAKNELVKVMTRLIGIDTPEIRSKDPAEKALATKARDYVAKWVLGKAFDETRSYKEAEIKQLLWEQPSFVYVRCKEQDKYGRVLAEFYSDEESLVPLNRILIDKGYADAYDGGTKTRSWAA